MTAFDRAWDVVKDDDWDWFHPDYDTCDGCGGQMTPHWPGYGPDGPENGNCAQELPECDVRYMFDLMQEAGYWGQLGLAHDADPETMIRWIHDERGKGNHNFPSEGFEERMRDEQ